MRYVFALPIFIPLMVCLPFVDRNNRGLEEKYL